MNVFSNLRTYGEKWKVVSKRKFDDDEVSIIREAEVVPSDYGASVCFFMQNGGSKYIPVSTESELTIGSSVDLSKVMLVELERGEERIFRVELPDIQGVRR